MIQLAEKLQRANVSVKKTKKNQTNIQAFRIRVFGLVLQFVHYIGISEFVFLDIEFPSKQQSPPKDFY